MPRTRANQPAARRVVAAKAPRKLPPAPTRVTPTSSSKGKVSKRKSTGGSRNSVKSWSVPSWQKGITLFLPKIDTSKEPGSSGSGSGDDSSFEGPSGTSSSSNEQFDVSLGSSSNVQADLSSDEE